jgi:hypothetical protein
VECNRKLPEMKLCLQVARPVEPNEDGFLQPCVIPAECNKAIGSWRFKFCGSRSFTRSGRRQHEVWGLAEAVEARENVGDGSDV